MGFDLKWPRIKKKIAFEFPYALDVLCILFIQNHLWINYVVYCLIDEF